MSSPLLGRTGVVALVAVATLFMVNEIAVFLWPPSVAYIIGRLLIIPCVAGIALLSTGVELTRGRVHGRDVLLASVTILCLLSIVAFQFFASYPVAKYLGLWAR